MIRWKKWILLGLVVCVGVFILGTIANAKVTVTLWKASHGADPKIIPPILKAFEEANPDIKVDFLSHPWEGWDERYGMAFVGETPPDVSYMPDEFWPKFAVAGLLAKFDELFPEDLDVMRKDYPDAFWRLTKFRGHQYGVPYLWVAIVLFYNEDIFDKAGLTYPPSDTKDPYFPKWTWDEFVRVAKTLTNPDKDQWGYAWSAAFRDPNYLYPFFYQAGTDVLDLEKNRAAFDGPEGIKAFQFMVDLVHKYKVVPADGMHPRFHEVFYEGKAAMGPVESYSVVVVRTQYPELKVGAAFNPQGPGVDFYSGRGGFGNSGYWVMAKACENKDAAWKLINWLTTRENGQTFCDGVGLFGCRLDFRPDPKEPLYKVFWDSRPFFPGYPLHPKLRHAHSLIMPEAQKAVLLEKTPEQAIKDAAAAVNAALQE